MTSRIGYGRLLAGLAVLQCSLGVFCLLRGDGAFERYMQVVLSLFAVTALALVLCLRFVPQAMRMAASCCGLLQIGMLLQCILGEYSAAVLVRNLWLAAAAAAVVVSCYLIFGRRLSPKAYLWLSGLGCAAIMAFLLVQKLLAGASVGVSVDIGGKTIHLVLAAIPLWAVWLSAAVCVQTSENKRFALAVVPYLAAMALFFLLSELGTALMFTVLLLFYLLMYFDVKYLLLAVGTLAVGGAAAWVLLFFASGIEGGPLIGLMQSIYAKLLTRFTPGGYQLTQARQAIAVGGLWGSSLQVYVPIASSDLAFSMLCLKLGSVVAVLSLMLFVVLFFEIKGVHGRTERPFERALSAGLLFSIVFQSFYVITSATGFLPITGMPIAFISYSGSYLALVMIAMSLVIAVQKRPANKRRNKK